MKNTITGVLSGAVVCAVAISLTTALPAQAAASSSFDLGASLAIPELGAVRVDTSEVQLANSEVTPSNLSVKYDAPYTAYTTTLQNDFPIQQSMTSQSSTFTTTDTTTATVETGITNTGGAQATVGFTAGFFNASTNFRWEVQSSVKYTDTTTTTLTTAWTVPGQSVTVPANSKAVVQAEIQKAVFSGTLALKGDLTGNVNFTNGCGETFSLPVGKVLALRKDDGTVVTPSSVVPDGDVARFSGRATFSGATGTSMTVKVGPAGGATQTKAVKNASPQPQTAAPRSAARAAVSAAPTVDTSGITTFAALANKLKCGSMASTAAHSYVLSEDGRVLFVANGVTVVSPASLKFTSLAGDSDKGASYALAVATDGSVWITRDNNQMSKISLPKRAKATAGHAYVLDEDGRVSFVANGVTVVSPDSLKFTSITGDAADGASYVLGIATDGSVWSTRDNNKMTKVGMTGRAKATAGHGYVLGDDGRVSFVADGKVTVVSPSSAVFTSVSADWAQGNNYALAITTDGTVWMTQNGTQMKQIPLSGPAKATAGHGFVLGADGRITYVATSWWNAGTAVVSPSSLKFTSITGDWEHNNVALALATDGTVWTARDANGMQKITMPSTGR